MPLIGFVATDRLNMLHVSLVGRIRFCFLQGPWARASAFTQLKTWTENAQVLHPVELGAVLAGVARERLADRVLKEPEQQYLLSQARNSSTSIGLLLGFKGCAYLMQDAIACLEPRLEVYHFECP